MLGKVRRADFPAASWPCLSLVTTDLSRLERLLRYATVSGNYEGVRSKQKGLGLLPTLCLRSVCFDVLEVHAVHAAMAAAAHGRRLLLRTVGDHRFRGDEQGRDR